jgi:hypothetical protein
MRSENNKYAYQTELFQGSLINAYIDDTLLKPNLVEGL